MLPEKESLIVEFKSDQTRLPDYDLVATVVCLANTEGGEIYLGVEDDGAITGLHPQHQQLTGLAALIANRTNPPLGVRVEALEIEGKRIAKINVPRSRHLVSTSEGLLQRRRLMADGTPQCVPFYPHEFLQRQSDLGLLDYSSLPITEATLQDFDPLERERLRQMIEQHHGDRALLTLSDQELEGALGLVRQEDSERIPTTAGLLILGRESALRRFLPTHEVAFQVLQGTQVRVNDFYRTPLLKTFERVMDQCTARIEEDEILLEGFRVPIPNYDVHAVREAIVNALTHRDYTRLGAVHVRLQSEGLVVSNPGGFVEGVTVKNLLHVDPRPRNPLLADIFKRIGLAERTGRGIDLIYEGMLRYGRPAPDYSRSDRVAVVLQLKNAPANLPFFRKVLAEEKKRGGRLPVNELLLTAQNLLDSSYPASAHNSPYIRETGETLLPGQPEQIVLQYVQKYGRIRRKEAMDLCQLTENQAANLLRQLKHNGRLTMRGKGRGTFYILP